jgi:hypothetical protein
MATGCASTSSKIHHGHVGMKRIHFQHVLAHPTSRDGSSVEGKSMRIAQSHYGTGRKPIQALLGWIFAVFIVVVAVFGPPLTSQSVPSLVELRHDILMLDREFERSSLRSNTTFIRTSTVVHDDLRRAGGTRPKVQVRGDVS